MDHKDVGHDGGADGEHHQHPQDDEVSKEPVRGHESFDGWNDSDIVDGKRHVERNVVGLA